MEEVQSSISQTQPQQNSLPSSAPVDAIMIVSGKDAVTVSDNTEEDNSVCPKKGQTSKHCRKQQPYSSQLLSPSYVQTGQDFTDEIVVVDSESDESSDSHSIPPFVVDLNSDSESDGLENWGIFGREKQERDQNIKLNLSVQHNCKKQEYVKDGREELNWAVSVKDKKAKLCNKGVGPRRLSNRYYNAKSVTCRNCNKIGHLSKNCPTPKKVPCCSLCGLRGHLVRTCPNRHCSNCSLPGHTYDDCLERAYWHKCCHRCGMTGHFIDACPEIWRQYHLTTTPGPLNESSNPNACKTPAYCYNCSEKGHFGYECTKRRMYNGTYPTLPFVSYYDKTQDIKCRDQRLKKKARELWGDGLMVPPDGGLVSFTPEPPRKKPKTNHKQSPYRPHSQTNNPHMSKRDIAHTPKHHPQPHKQNTPLKFKQNPKTPSKCEKNTPHSAFTPQGQRKAKKTNSAVIVIDEDADFPRGCNKDPQTKVVLKSPRTANERPDALFRTGKNNNKKKDNLTKKKERKWRKRQKNAAKDAGVDVFGIKQKQSR